MQIVTFEPTLFEEQLPNSGGRCQFAVLPPQVGENATILFDGQRIPATVVAVSPEGKSLTLSAKGDHIVRYSAKHGWRVIRMSCWGRSSWHHSDDYVGAKVELHGTNAERSVRADLNQTGNELTALASRPLTQDMLDEVERLINVLLATKADIHGILGKPSGSVETK